MIYENILEIRVNSNDKVISAKSGGMLKIKEFAKLCGCKVYTLRYYDEIGLLKPCITLPESKYRYYRKEQKKEFIRIKKLQEIGFTTEEMKQIPNQSNQETQRIIQQKIRALKKVIQKAEILKKEFKREASV